MQTPLARKLILGGGACVDKPKGNKGKSTKSATKTKSKKSSGNLYNFIQWREEVGYWIGELPFYQGDGTPN
jgi:hypothetical protein